MFHLQQLPREPFVRLCQDLVRTPSVNGADPEARVAEQVVAFARAQGLAAELAGELPGRPNALVRVGPAGPAGLLLIAHLDTVPPGRAEDWTWPPFGAQIDGGRLYGRGAADTKGGLVAALAALVLLQRQAGERLRAPALLACVPDEESGATGRLGVRYLHARGLLSGRGAIYVYPGMDELVVGHRGVLRLTLRAHGRAAHTGSAGWQQRSPGGNAVTALAEILLALERHAFATAETGLFAPFRTVITPTTIRGGSGPSIVADTCEAHVDIRLVPSVPREMVEQAVRAIAGEVARRRAPLQVELREEVFIPPTQIAPEAPIVAACHAATRLVLGREPPLAVSGPANESYILNELGIPTCILGPAGQNVHAPDEYVEVDSIFQAALIYAYAALHL